MSFIKKHFHIILYSYFWFGLFICGLAAPDTRVALLESALISEGWHLSLLSLIFILPVPILYLMRLQKKQ